jgi:D-glycero-D-manno-heptose 1,7-bisphosphate phosphatase
MAEPRPAAVFLDRDGTLIEDVGYPRDPQTVRILPGVVDALHRLTAAGLLLIVVSNQSGIGRGIVTPEEADAVHERFVADFAAAGIQFADVRYCPHGPEDGCRCRKPSPGMLHDAAVALWVSLSDSFMVGDKVSDVEAGRRAGCRAVLLNSPEDAAIDADLVTTDWREAVDFILNPTTSP